MRVRGARAASPTADPAAWKIRNPARENPLTGTCTCTESCFTSTAYGNLDGDASLSVMIYTHPDRLGNFCESGQGGNQSPPFENGARMFDQVARVLVADDF